MRNSGRWLVTLYALTRWRWFLLLCCIVFLISMNINFNLCSKQATLKCSKSFAQFFCVCFGFFSHICWTVLYFYSEIEAFQLDDLTRTSSSDAPSPPSGKLDYFCMFLSRTMFIHLSVTQNNKVLNIDAQFLLLFFLFWCTTQLFFYCFFAQCTPWRCIWLDASQSLCAWDIKPILQTTQHRTKWLHSQIIALELAWNINKKQKDSEKQQKWTRIGTKWIYNFSL